MPFVSGTFWGQGIGNPRLSYGSRSALGVIPGGEEFLRDLGFLPQQMDAEKRLIMVKLYHDSSPLAVLSSRSNGGRRIPPSPCAPRAPGLRQGRDTLPFCYSIIPPFPAGPGGTRANARNEPNCPKRGTEAVSRLRIADWGQTCGRSCETKPIPAAPGGAGPRGRGAIVQNKPNFRRRKNEVNCCCGKWLREFGTTCRSCKTNPIARSGAPRRCLDCGFRIADWIRSCAGTPPAPCCPRPRRADCAKRTQFRGRSCETKPILDCGLGTDLLCRTARPATCVPGLRGPVVQTNPISRRRQRHRLYKQTQWARRIPIVPVFHHSTVPVQCLLCETKPIPAAPGGTRPRGRGAWGVCTNKANFPALAMPGQP
jgi:hypothetical protein